MNKVMPGPRILSSPTLEDWAAMAAKVIRGAIDGAISRRGVCNIMLTGGNTAERLYNYWAKSSSLPMEHMRVLFGDERCVPPDHPDSNYALAMKTLFAKGVPPGCEIIRMEAENADREAAAKRYEALIPEEIDILLLGMGADGHIASLFPHSAALIPAGRSVLPVAGADLHHERMTITPKIIAKAGEVFVLAVGEEKGLALAEALRSPEDFMALPVRLTLGGTWLLDDVAAQQLR